MNERIAFAYAIADDRDRRLPGSRRRTRQSRRRPMANTAGSTSRNSPAHGRPTSSANQVNSDKLELFATFAGRCRPASPSRRTDRVFVELPAVGRSGRVHRRRDRATARLEPYPEQLDESARHGEPDRSTLVAVQSVVVDDAGPPVGASTPAASTSARLSPAAPKLVVHRPEDQQVVKTINFKPDSRAADDVPQRRPLRPEPRQGGDRRSSPTRRDRARTASSSSTSPAAKLAAAERSPVDQGRAELRADRRRRAAHVRPSRGQPEAYMKIGSDGIAISRRWEDALLLPAGRPRTCTA